MQKALAITASAILLTIAVAAYSQDRDADRPPVQFKAGTVLSLTTHASGGAVVYIQDPTVQKLGEAWFIVGIVPDIKGFPHIGNRIWIPLNSISLMYEFKSAEEIRKLLAIPQNPAA